MCLMFGIWDQGEDRQRNLEGGGAARTLEAPRPPPPRPCTQWDAPNAPDALFCVGMADE